MKVFSGRTRSHVGIVDKAFGNLYAVHTDLFKTNATLKDRAAFNLKIWGGQNIFGVK